MTEIGWDYLKKALRSNPISWPEELDVDAAAIWLDGYRRCFIDIMEVIDRLSQGQKG